MPSRRISSISSRNYGRRLPLGAGRESLAKGDPEVPPETVRVQVALQVSRRGRIPECTSRCRRGIRRIGSHPCHGHSSEADRRRRRASAGGTAGQDKLRDSRFVGRRMARRPSGFPCHDASGHPRARARRSHPVRATQMLRLRRFKRLIKEESISHPESCRLSPRTLPSGKRLGRS